MLNPPKTKTHSLEQPKALSVSCCSLSFQLITRRAKICTLKMANFLEEMPYNKFIFILKCVKTLTMVYKYEGVIVE